MGFGETTRGWRVPSGRPNLRVYEMRRHLRLNNPSPVRLGPPSPFRNLNPDFPSAHEVSARLTPFSGSLFFPKRGRSFVPPWLRRRKFLSIPLAQSGREKQAARSFRKPCRHAYTRHPWLRPRSWTSIWNMTRMPGHLSPTLKSSRDVSFG